MDDVLKRSMTVFVLEIMFLFLGKIVRPYRRQAGVKREFIAMEGALKRVGAATCLSIYQELQRAWRAIV